MPGLGAWSKGSLTRQSDPTDERVEAQIHAIKAEMIYRGLGTGVKLDVPFYGSTIEARVRTFQENSNGALAVTGNVGPKTASYIFWTRCVRACLAAPGKIAIPGRYVWKLINLEAAHDPAAQGYVDPRDEGGAQIHMPYHPEITVEQAWDPAFYIPWLAGNLRSTYVYVGNDWDGAIAAHNVGQETARLWVADGKPASGRIRDNIDWYARATRYVALVKGQKAPA